MSDILYYIIMFVYALFGIFALAKKAADGISKWRYITVIIIVCAMAVTTFFWLGLWGVIF